MIRNASLSEVAASAQFADTVRPYLLLDRELTIYAANQAYASATGRTREELRGQYMFDAFPDNPDDPQADGVAKLGASFEDVLRTKRRSLMWVQRYDVRGQSPSDPFVLKYWSPTNDPIRDHLNRNPIGIVHHVEDVTRLWSHIRGDSELATEITATTTDSQWASFIMAVRTNEHLYQQLRREADQLQEALNSRIVVEQAKGVLIAQRRCNPQQAFDTLRAFARSNNLDIHVVAQSLVEQVHQPKD